MSGEVTFRFAGDNYLFVEFGKVIDEEINKKVEESTNFKAQRHRIEFFGLCDKCSAAKKN